MKIDPKARVVPELKPVDICTNVTNSDDKTATICASEGEIGSFIVEMVCSFFFIAIILMVKNPITAPSKEGYLCCWTVGITLLGQICLAGNRTGAALNPAVGLSINFFDNWQLNTTSFYQYMWIYTAGPYAGGAIAGFFHHYHVWTTSTVLGHEKEENVAAVIYD